MLSTPYILQLDDDAFPVQGDLVVAAEWLESHPDAVALAPVIAECDNFEADLHAVPAEPFPCHYFVGCGALLHRERFHTVGGYDNLLQFYVEDIAFGARASLSDKIVYQYPALVVRHNRSPVSRNLSRRSFLLVRNELLLALLRYPIPFLLLRWPSILIKSVLQKWATPAIALSGLFAALRMAPKALALRKTPSIKSFSAWKQSPTPIIFLPKATS